MLKFKIVHLSLWMFNENQQCRLQQQNSIFHLAQRQRFKIVSHLQGIAGTLPGVKENKFYQLIYDDIIQSQIAVIKSKDIFQNQLSKNQLLNLISILKDKNQDINPKVYQNAIKLLKSAISNKISLILNNMEQNMQIQYNDIAIKKFNRLKIIGFQLNQQAFTKQFMLRVDVLSYFLKRNKYYRLQHNYQDMNIISQKMLVQILKLPKSDISSYVSTFNEIQQWLEYSFEVQFKDLITLAAFFGLKFKISNFNRRYGKNRQFENYAQDSQCENIKNQNHGKSNQQKEFIFRLCQITLLPFGKANLEKRSEKVKQQIITALKMIERLPINKAKKEQIMNLAIKYSINLRQICEYYQKTIKEAGTARQNLKSINKINFIQWIQLLKQTGTPLASQNQSLKESILIYERFYSNATQQLQFQMFVMAFERLCKYRKMINLFLKIDQQQILTVYAFQITPHHLQHRNQSNQRNLIMFRQQFEPQIQEDKNEKYTVVFVANKSKLICSIVVETCLSSQDQIIILKSILKATSIKNVNMIVNFRIRQTGFDIKIHKRIMAHLKPFNCSPFFVNDPNCFLPHRAMEIMLLEILQKIDVVTKESIQYIIQHKISKSWNYKYSQKILENIF